MRFSIFAAAAAALLVASPVLAQDDDWEWDEDEQEYREKIPTGGYFGGDFTIAQSRGEFADYVDGGFGGQLHYIHQLDRDGWIGVRADAGIVVYGYERQRVPLSSTLGGRILVDLNTSNNIAFVGIGPQIGVPDGRLRPYVNGYVGYSFIWTSSSVSGTGWDDEDFASTTNFDDWSFSHGVGGGVYVPLRGGPSPVSLDLGVRYRDNGEAEYLREGDIEDNPDGSITLYPVRSDTDLLTFHVGFTVGVSH
jgi:hypothetical protein